MTATVTTWLDGRIQTVPADDPRIAEQERLRVRLMHVVNMRRLALHVRRGYLVNVERREGVEAAEALRAAFTADWEARRAQR